MSEVDAKYRLSRVVQPTHYSLCIKTDLEAEPSPSFEGTAEIDVEVREETDRITLHASPTLEILKVVFQPEALKGSEPEVVKDIERDEKFERLTLSLSSKLAGGSVARIGIVYRGVLEGNMMGYYRSSYESEGRRGFYGLTQFEPTAARRAFPCWDEPAIKATVQVRLITKDGTTALTNTSPISSRSSDGNFPDGKLLSSTHLEGIGKSSSSAAWTLTEFEPTPKVSTYLVAWANGPFSLKESHYISPLTQKKIPLRVFATAEHAHQTQLLLDTTARILPVYEKIFDIPYPLSKLDTLVASDFDAGAMENWGLITCRTSVGLFDDASGIAARKRVVSVQSHEVAHQWFGNIVTMSWWQELWLNEAFATLMGELVIISEIEPNWHAEDDFINAHLSRALDLDSKRSSHAVEVPCPDPEMINQIFDAISYSKGASILKMLANFVGKEKFLHGVSLYLKAHLYGNGTTKDLWAGISKSTGKDIENIMKNWTGKIGFPVLTVVEEPQGLRITQNRFLSTGDPKPEEDGTLWFVPLEIKVVDADGHTKVHHDVLDSERETFVKLRDPQSLNYKLNADTCGVYRVRYPADRLEKLGRELAKSDSSFTVADKMGLIQDAVVLAQAGYSSTSCALDILHRLGGEKNHLVWSEISQALDSVSNILWEQDQEVTKGFDKFQRNLVSDLAKEIGFDTLSSDNEDRIQLRVKILGLAARSGDQSVLDEIKERFQKFVKDPVANKSIIPADLRLLVFGQAVKHGGEDEYEAVLSVYRKPSNPSDKIAAMCALCATREEALLKRTFDFILSGEVKEQDFMYFFSSLARNKHSRRDMWKFVETNFEELMKRFKGNFSIGRLIQYSFDQLTGEEDRLAVQKFFADKDTSIFQSALAQGLDTVKSHVAWLDRDKKNIVEWLKSNQYI
ncbi:hypothetical protein BY996DRAFT_4583678 [Phakopsora pachyrhizi]|uniref:Aminopeptidase n=1 Tax=Phakopsora pachyrhizi TaxID=170000 RepID=A0AAV0AHP0_PHAPC|nr:hypothetical protein BY996DRAFT_4583678 [Phakopsora pachyrhizi]CAH7667912.1 hypothetical protein PPACK8108_LOCUS2354 [Phakopsora pachyrhizi]